VYNVEKYNSFNAILHRANVAQTGGSAATGNLSECITEQCDKLNTMHRLTWSLT